MATYPIKNIGVIGGDTYKIAMPPVFVIKCSDTVTETSWTDWQSGGRTLPTPTLYKDGVVSNDWSELTSTSNVSFELTADDINYATFKLSDVYENPGYGSSSYQFEYIGTEAGSLPDSFAYIVRIGFFGGSLTTNKGYRVPLIAQSGGGGGGSTNIYTISTSFPNLNGSTMQSITLDATLTAAQLRTNMDAGVVRIKDSQGSEVTLLGYNTNGLFFGAGMDISGSTIRIKMESSWGTNWNGLVTSL